MRATRFISVLALVIALGIPTAMAAADSKAPTEQDVFVHEETATGEAQASHEAAAGEHGEGGLPQLRIETYPSQIFWLVVTFAILYLTFSKSTLPLIGSVIEMRESKIKGDLDAAEAMRAQSEEIRTAYEMGLEQARAEATAAIADVEAKAKQKAADRVDAFRKKSETDITAAEGRMDDVRAKSMNDMTAIAAEVASVAAEKITGVSGDVQKAKAIVETIAGKAKAA